eukprot:TRINITY_DN1211_c0_g1_i1.p1 TRINITY_DN1211_c0_g1~~TRINITY_DN1211_c0_g1_i1.p1  ORF type:complete len:458 (+),score=105.78 TRINITY_DN1211_c0_g1_i1:158-1531(+)
MFSQAFRALNSVHYVGKRFYQAKLLHTPGNARYVKDTRHVSLRGTLLRGNYNDLPNLIFFTEALDPVESWFPFFSDPSNQFLEYRNIWIVNPRNFGNSDRHPSYDLNDMADDVVRFMYENKITMATLGGHGFGAKVALATGCYHSERVTGVFALDGAPLDHRYFDAFKEFTNYVVGAKDVDLRRNRADIEADIAKLVKDKKWRSIFLSNLVRSGEGYNWNFEINYLAKNLSYNKADSIGYWAEKHGVFTGRNVFIFPEYSRWVHLNSNTLAIHKVCLKNRGYGHDIFAIQGDEDPNNHWIYEQDLYTFPVARKLLRFLRLYDGVHTLLADRSEVGNYFIPDRINSRSQAGHVYSDYSPAHLHHNWRFSHIYEDAKKFDSPIPSDAKPPAQKKQNEIQPSILNELPSFEQYSNHVQFLQSSVIFVSNLQRKQHLTQILYLESRDPTELQFPLYSFNNR